MSCVTRDVVDADLEKLRQHRNEPSTRCWLGYDEPVSPEQQQTWWKSGAASRCKIVVADGCEVGLARVEVEDGVGCVGCDVFAEHRGHGRGHAVFAAACDEAVAMGARSLWLLVFIENTAAVRVYLRAGFAFAPDSPVTAMRRMVPWMSDVPVLVHYARMERAS